MSHIFISFCSTEPEKSLHIEFFVPSHEQYISNVIGRLSKWILRNIQVTKMITYDCCFFLWNNSNDYNLIVSRFLLHIFFINSCRICRNDKIYNLKTFMEVRWNYKNVSGLPFYLCIIVKVLIYTFSSDYSNNWNLTRRGRKMQLLTQF